MNFNIPQYRECDTCEAKLGSPILCNGCLQNREAISMLEQELTFYRKVVEALR